MSNTHKRIVLSGYFGYDNAGDEAILYSLIQELKQRHFEPIVLSGAPLKTAETYHCKAVDRMDMKQVIQAILQSDGVISGGGSLLQDQTSAKNVIYYLSVIELAYRYQKPVFFLSQGVGPIDRKWLHFSTRFVVNHCAQVSVRDQASELFLKDVIGIKQPVTLSADPVLLLDSDAWNTSVPEELAVFLQKNPVYLSLRDWKHADKWREEARLLVEQLLAEGTPVLLAPLHTPTDQTFLSELYAGLEDHPDVFLPTDPLTFHEHLHCIQHSELVIGMRLHALIFSATVGTPFIGISYDPKIDAFLELFEYTPAATTDTFEASVVLSAVHHIQENRDFTLQHIRSTHEGLRRLASKPFHHIATYFENGEG